MTKTEVGQQIGQQIRSLRVNAGLSQAALARFLGVTRSAVQAWEENRYAPPEGILEHVKGVVASLVQEKTSQTPRDDNDDEMLNEARCLISRQVDALQQTLGHRLRHAREIKGVTQKELAERLGISESMLSLYESNDRRLPAGRLKEIAENLEVSADYFLGLSYAAAGRLPSGPEVGAVMGWWAEESINNGAGVGVGLWPKRLEAAYEEERKERAARGKFAGDEEVYNLIIAACRKTGISYTLAFPCRRLLDKINMWRQKNGWSEYEMMLQLGYLPGRGEDWEAAFVRCTDWVTLFQSPKAMISNEAANPMFDAMAHKMGITVRELFDDNVPVPAEWLQDGTTEEKKEPVREPDAT